jgi:two-component system, response regulator YesN
MPEPGIPAMYNILIVDDEKMICEGIRKAVPWSGLGISSAYTALSGYEALNLLGKYEIQIVITDINMSGMTGLELISRIRQQSPDMRILVLTGYDKFEYARECLRMSVADFLLKPVDEVILEDAVRKQIGWLDRQNELKYQKVLQERRQSVVDEMEIERIVLNLLHNRVCLENEYGLLFTSYHFPRDVKLQTVFLYPEQCGMSGSASERVTSAALKNVCILLVDAQSAGITVTDIDGKIVVTFFITQQNTLDDNIARLEKILKTEYGCFLRKITGSVVSGYRNLYLSYNEAVWKKEQDKMHFRELLPSVCSGRRLDTFRDVYEELKNRTGDSIGNKAAVMHLFDTFCQAVDTYALTAEHTCKCCFDLVSYAYFCSSRVSDELTDRMLHDMGKTLSHAEKNDAIEITRSWLLRIYGSDDDDRNGIIAKARSYIDANLEKTLSVADVADRLCVTPNYLSRLFSQNTGEGCNEYMVRKRLEKARLLLTETDLPAGKIAFSVGYNDINYFSLAFKKFTGLSPTAYRKSVRTES